MAKRHYQPGEVIRAEDIPGPDASQLDMIDFALMYDGYQRIASNPRDLRAALGPLLDEVQTGVVPEWAESSCSGRVLPRPARSANVGR